MKNLFTLKKQGRWLALAAALAAGTAMAQPTTSPYRERYLAGRPEAGIMHWTDSLAAQWSAASVHNINSIPGALSGTAVNVATLQSYMNSLSAQGGGMIYFPAGSYTFSDNLEIPTGIVLAGETPSVRDARDANYRPASKLEFPAYVFDPTANGGLGTDNNTAFKAIRLAVNAHHVGIVNLDINRARIEAHPSGYTQNSFGFYQGNDYNHHVLIFGVRNNNTAIPDPTVPRSNHQGWQRYPWRFAANIDLYLSGYGIVANNRLNDAPTDDFAQPGYVGECQGAPADGSWNKFRYTDHYGISLNRAKIYKDANNNPAIYAFQTYARPEVEPDLYRPGQEVLDNYVYKTSRIGITAAGDGLKMIGNETDDELGKVVYLTPNGSGCQTNNSATYENRGIDFSGWNVTVRDNKIFVSNALIRGGYPTVDGESILVQECCGGTIVKDYTIVNNTLDTRGSGYIGIYKMRDIHNLRIDSNDLGCKPIWVFADLASGSTYSVFNASINNNTNVGSISIQSGSGGNNINLLNNSKGSCSGSGNITGPGWANVSGNTGMNNNTSGGTPTVPPTVSLLQRDTLIIVQSATALPTLPLAYDFQNADSVAIYEGTRLAAPVEVAVSGGVFNYAVPRLGVTNITLQGRSAVGIGWSNNARITVGVVTSTSRKLPQSAVVLMPNPSSGLVRMTLDKNLYEGSVLVQVYAQTGVLAYQKSHGAEVLSSTGIDLSNLAAGMYQVRVTSAQGSVTKRFVKE